MSIKSARQADDRAPEGWRSIPLGVVADVRFSSVDKLTRSSENPVRLCNYIDVYTNDYITAAVEFMAASANLAEIKRFGLQLGDVILTKDSESPEDIGIPAVVDYAASDLVCGYHLGLIRPDQTQVDPTFLSKQLGDSRLARYFGRQANGLTRYGLPIGAVTNAPIWLPKIEQQSRIGQISRLLDAAIDQAGAAMAKLKYLRAGFLHDLLTRGLDEHGEMRPPPSRAPDLYHDTSYGKIPREWRVAPLSVFVPIAEYGISNSLGAQGFPVLRMNNFAEGEADLTDLKFTQASPPETLWLHPLDVLFNRTNSWEHVGRTGIWRGQIEQATFASYLVRLKPRADLLLPELLTLWLNWPVVQTAMRRFATPAVQQVNINPTNLRKIEAAFPTNLHEQAGIITCISKCSAAIGILNAEHRKLIEVRAGLTADLLSGRTRVPETLDLEEAAQ